MVNEFNNHIQKNLNMIKFSDLCTITTTDFQSLFEISNIECTKTDELVDFIFNEFKRTRLHLGSIEPMFKTFSEIKKMEQKIIPTCWDIVKDFLGNFPVDPIDYDSLKNKLENKNLNKIQVEQALCATKLLHDTCAETLSANVNAIKQSTDRKIGLIGELFSFIYSRDIQKTHCLFHKLVLDNPNSTRTGLDLLAVKFAKDPNDDEVHFWEAKSTLSNFDGQLYKIVKWFNTEKEKKRISNVIEAARIYWEKCLPFEEFERASIALAKFQADQKNFKFIGSIVYDMNITPSKESIAKFDKIMVEKNNKNLILFNTEKLEELVNEVYDKTCVA